MSFLQSLPSSEELLSWHKEHGSNAILENNGHIHTPYSFSAFQNIQQPFDLARQEGIKILGVNDFFVTDGYPEFHDNAVDSKVFPLFNIEFIGLLKEKQEKNVRINDPGNPGRIYFSGKGLNYPTSFPQEITEVLNKVRDESQAQVEEMILKANDLLGEISNLSISYTDIKVNYAKELVRERHIATAIRKLAFEEFISLEERKSFFNALCGGVDSTAGFDNHAALENEIRSKLLKKGGAAFVEEDDTAFLPLSEIIEIIVSGGGIPCYPVLLDNHKGEVNEFEANNEALYQDLIKHNIHCIELIPNRNGLKPFKAFVEWFEAKGFVILYGTEHNTPALTPLAVDTRGGVPLDNNLKRIGYEGCCVIAAHQYLKANKKEGYLDATGKPKVTEKAEFISLGKAVIEFFLAQ